MPSNGYTSRNAGRRTPPICKKGIPPPPPPPPLPPDGCFSVPDTFATAINTTYHGNTYVVNNAWPIPTLFTDTHQLNTLGGCTWSFDAPVQNGGWNAWTFHAGNKPRTGSVSLQISQPIGGNWCSHSIQIQVTDP